MTIAAFGRIYEGGEVIARQGELADGLYVVQDGTVDIVAEDGDTEVVLRSAGRNEIIGEMAIFGGSVRSATMRSRGRSRVMTLDKRNFMRRMSEDPTLAFAMIEVMGNRVRELSREVVRLRVRAEASALVGADGIRSASSTPPHPPVRLAGSRDQAPLASA